MGSHNHLDTSNTSYGQKKGRESNWQLDSRPLKVSNRPNSFAYRWRAEYRWKDLKKGYNFALNLISIRGLHTKLWAPKVAGVPTLGISGLPLGSPKTNDISVLVPWLGIEYTIRGKVVTSPKFGSWWVSWVSGCLWFAYALKCCNYALTKLLFGLCMFGWVI
jgi:hypothetical protein